MEETHTLFIATDELMKSPLIQGYAGMFDMSLTLGESRLISLMLPFRGNEEQLRKTLIYYDADQLDIVNASVYPSLARRLAILSLTVDPRDIGVTSITICTKEDECGQTQSATYVPDFIKNRPIS